MTLTIPLFKIYEDDMDIEAVANVIKRGNTWASGSEILKFEKKISEYIGTKYALTFNSGTSAMHSLLLACGIGQGDEVIVPSFTFIATANTPLFVNARPVFAEIEDKTYGLDPENIKEKITSKTKAIIPIHYAGCPCLIEEIKEIAEDYNLFLFEDAAESFGAKIRDQMVGSFGNAGILSFCQNKIITTGEGGAIVTDSKEIYERLKLIRSHGRLETQDYFASSEYMDYISLGYNFRMSTITAALGISQIEKANKIVEMRRNKAAYLTERLLQVEGILLPRPIRDFYHVYQMYSIRVDGNIRDSLIRYLSGKGISTKVYFPPVHLTDFYQKHLGYTFGQLPITEKLSNQFLSLPIFPTLTELEMDYIIEEINNYFGG